MQNIFNIEDVKELLLSENIYLDDRDLPAGFSFDYAQMTLVPIEYIGKGIRDKVYLSVRNIKFQLLKENSDLGEKAPSLVVVRDFTKDWIKYIASHYPESIESLIEQTIEEEGIIHEFTFEKLKPLLQEIETISDNERESIKELNETRHLLRESAYSKLDFESMEL